MFPTIMDLFVEKNDVKEPLPENSSLCLLRIPNLDGEQATQQNKNIKQLRQLQQSESGTQPTTAETNVVLEYLLFMAFFKLMEKVPAYQILKEALKNGNKEKVFEIMYYNAPLIEVFKKNSKNPDTKIHIFCTKDGYHIEGLKPLDVIKKIAEEQKEEIAEMKGQEQEDESVMRFRDELVSERYFSETATGNTRNECTKQDDENRSRSKFYVTHEDSTQVKNFSTELEEIMSLINRGNNDESDKLQKEHEKNWKADQQQFARDLHQKIQKEKEENEKIHKNVVKEMEAELEKIRKLNEEQEKYQREQEELAIQMEEANRNRLDEEFKRKLEEQKMKYEEVLKELREKRETIERKAEEARLKSLADFAARTKVFWQCVLLKMRWEDQEQEWADWLKELKIPVERAKIQFMKFQEAVGYSEDIDEEAIKTELKFLRLRTLSAHSVLYRAFFYLKNLSIKVPDRIFLRILMKNVREVAMKVLGVLENIDKIQINESMFESLKIDFNTFDSSDILSTWKLREIANSGDIAKYDNIEDPTKYGYEEDAPTDYQFEEVLESSEDGVKPEDKPDAKRRCETGVQSSS